MIDFHTHLLPELDDGSNNILESIEMLKSLKKQNIDTVIATPHFCREQNDANTFIKKREESFTKLKTALKSEGNLPNIILGAEVVFYNELYMLHDLEKLCIGSTRYILIELPFEKWTRRTYDGIYSLISNKGITPIIAHIDRYIKIQQDFKKIEQLSELDVIIQMNSSYVNGIFTKKRAMRLLRLGIAHLLGSDCHNMTSRPPTIGEAYRKIEVSLGSSYLKKIDRTGRKILGIAEKNY